MRRLRDRLTYANVVGTLALFLALGAGGAFAIDKIGSKKIKRNAVKSRHIATNAVKGRDVLESSLGIVPNADALDGRTLDDIVRRIDFARTNVVAASNVSLGTVAGVELKASCSDDAAGNTIFSLSGEDDTAGGTPEWEGLFTAGNGVAPVFEEDFGQFAPSDQIFFLVAAAPRNGTYWLTFRTAGLTVALQARYEMSNSGTGTGSCELHGVATIAD